jgi:predicted ester cyclase
MERARSGRGGGGVRRGRRSARRRQPRGASRRAAIRDQAAAILAAFPDFRLERLELVVDGDHDADCWVATGTYLGELFGMAPTGRRVRVEGATFTRLGVHGLVVEDVHFWDVAGLMAQLTDGAPSSPDSD